MGGLEDDFDFFIQLGIILPTDEYALFFSEGFKPSTSDIQVYPKYVGNPTRSYIEFQCPPKGAGIRARTNYDKPLKLAKLIL